ncbi:EF-hand domain-containing family member C2 [Thalassophryne amazonica]|uniref:EF-hand domain-containing family member C2 n=1 Tax=Thalassophryne amazonica TaxID=390379 RepID=UPI0014725288|nr:EF-hand domain-containing family member C2 [Thalassophryne amazonica]
MSLPFLPGYSPNKQLGKEKFHRSQIFNYFSGVPVLWLDKPGIGGELLNGQKKKPKCFVFPKGHGSVLPSWVAFDKQALCFDAYFQETVTQAQQETYRIRKCKIFFYLEDDTIQVVEAKNKNSGIPQGTLIHRRRIPLPPPNDNQFYNVYNFNISQQMVLYSRTFTLTNCDAFTRNFLTKLGVRLNDPTAVPDDPYSTLRAEMEKNMKPLRPYERHDTLKQFLDHDHSVLRFYCFWDDTDSASGDLRELILYYFLADDTIEICEVFSPNSGRYAVPKFLRRCKLPKHLSTAAKQPGETTERTVLNVLTSRSQGNCYILDSLRTGAVHEEFYRDCDLKIGGEVNVCGRRVILCDCDQFTKNYYRSKYGIEDFTPVQYKMAPAPEPPKPVPPYTGFGSEEDSLCSCKSLLPKQPKKDFRKLMEKDRCGLQSNVLQFRAKMVTSDPADRVFIISFFLCDDSISVFEPPQKNSGIIGGRFLGRGRVRKPGQELFKSQPSEFFTAQDLYVGAVLNLNNQHFQLLEADEFTLAYMEQHAEEFPKANVGTILSKLRSIPEEKKNEVKRFLTLSDPNCSCFISYESFRGLLTSADCGLSEHEAVALGRCFSEPEQPEVDVGLMLAVAQDFLRKRDFDKFPEMTRAFKHQDQLRTGRLSSKACRTICKAFQLPLPENLLTRLLDGYTEVDEVDYNAFLGGINWAENPALPVLADDALKFEVNLRSSGSSVKKVNYSVMLEDVFGGATNSTDPIAVAAT